MGARDDQRRRRERTRQVRHSIGSEFRRLRVDAGLSATAVAGAAGIGRSHYYAIEQGAQEARTNVLVAIADVLGADLVVRAYPGTGPRIHDAIQSRIVEELLRLTSARWRGFLEVPVSKPSRGYVDVVLDDRQAPRLVSTEVHSDLRRIEQQLRWAQDKTASLPSADLWRRFDAPPEVSSMLVLRSTARTREIVERFPEMLATRYPARAADVYAALTRSAEWPGSGLIWARVEGDAVTILATPPRGVTFGR